MTALNIYINGTVQGVGFRPFVYRLAKEMELNGYVRNTPKGVEIHIEGEASPELFLNRLRTEAPPNARIDKIETTNSEGDGLKDFIIFTTQEGEATVFAPPDLFICNDCLEELFNPDDRRYRYPFINCTNCGPRYTIIERLPYDRPKTAMGDFKMCSVCEGEYTAPENRRFHAEPNACPECGPQVSFIEDGINSGDLAIERAVKSIREGKIVAVKGLGGFHIVCDPFNQQTVRRLRNMKNRERKPFALMARSVEAVNEIAYFNDAEREMLISPSRPVVVLNKKIDIDNVCPGINTYGIMLPYTPIHALIMERVPVIIATSANFRDSPILRDEKEGLPELSDCILTHNRGIVMRCDDSVLKIVNGKRIFLRRGRGFVPEPVEINHKCLFKVLSLGGELKNTITILKDGYLITSQYLGDMEDLRNRRYLEEVIEHFSTLYSFSPDIISCDLHPDFTTTGMADRWGKHAVKVQHHIAHIYAVLAEYGLSPEEPFLGVAFDGTGYGEDGNIWGGEFFIGGSGRIKRLLHLKYVPQQGGDLSVKEPWRMALSYLIPAIGGVKNIGLLGAVEDKKVKYAMDAIAKKINSPMTSSMGRLFDAVSAITGIAPVRIDYEAEPAMRLESTASDDNRDSYQFDIKEDEIDMKRMIAEIVNEIENKEDVSVISGKFHNTIAVLIATVAANAKDRFGITRIILSGGVFLNAVLLKACMCVLNESGMDVYVPERFSPGDEAISLGQAYYTALKLGRG